jgi:hypothetical protein
MAQITVTGTILDSNHSIPTSGTLTFTLSDYMIESSGTIIPAKAESCNISAVDGSFSVVLGSTLDATPTSRVYSVSLSAVIEGTTVSQSLGTIQLAASPSSVVLSDLIISGLAGGTAVTPTLSAADVSLTLRETDQALPLGLWRIRVNGDVLTFEKNTAVAGDFGTLSTFLSLSAAGIWTFTKTAVGVTSTDGMVLQNTTAAAAGAQQYSPRLRLAGQGWKTTATAASQQVDWIIENQPVQGSANPTTNLVISSQVNGGGYSAQLTLQSGGNALFGGTAQITRLGVAAAADGAVPLLVSAASGQFLKITGATTGNQYARASNTGADLLWGIESSAGGTLFSGASAYASVLGTINSTSLQFATNNTVQMTIASSGSIGVGGTTNASSIVTVGQGTTWTGAAGNSSGALLINPTLNPGANNSEYGIVIQPTLQKAGSGTHPNMMGITIGLAFGAGASAVTDAIGIDISSFSAPASTTNATGLRVAAPTGATNNYAIHATSGSVVFDSVGPHAIGTTPNANFQLALGGSFTGATTTYGLRIGSTFTATVGNDVHGIAFEGTLQNAASGTNSVMSALRIAPTFAATAGATIVNALGIDIPTFAAPTGTTIAAGLRIAAPTAAGTNYAIDVTSGSCIFAGNMGFFSATPAAQQTSGANLTNNVTSGGSNDTIANFTDLTTYSNDAATIRNDIYQLARKVKQINDGLRTFGLFT